MTDARQGVPLDASTGLLVLDTRDDVAVATRELAVGERFSHDGRQIEVCEPIPVGHKVALAPIDRGSAVRKYGEVIGTATAPIGAGAHVHVHNVVSARLPGSSG